MDREIADGRRARKVNFAVDVEIASEIEKVKHGHGKRERRAAAATSSVRARSESSSPAGARALARIKAHIYLRTVAVTLRTGDQVTAFPCYRSTRGPATVIYFM